MEFQHWDKLIYGIRRRECILFLGPQLPVVSQDGKRLVSTQDLASRLMEQLDENKNDRLNYGPNDLAQISQRFLAQEGEVSLEMEISRWNEKFRKKDSLLHTALANLPFHYIVTSSHDSIMEAALKNAKKNPFIEFYHYKGKNKELLPEATDNTPVLFRLYGSVSEPSSVVITETQLLDFLAALISKDPPLPNDLNAVLTHGRLFMFLGFGLHQWYLRILLHVLKVLRPKSRSFAVELGDNGFDSSEDDAVLFYRQNYKVDIYKGDIFEFVKELRRRYKTSETADDSPETAKSEADTAAPQLMPKVFICHASEDSDHAGRIHDGLARADFDPWIDKKSLRGGDRWDELIESTIEDNDYFVVLNSQNLRAKSQGKSYVNKEIKIALRAADYRFGTFIIPIKIDDSPLLEQFKEYHSIDLKDSEDLTELIRAIKRDFTGI